MPIEKPAGRSLPAILSLKLRKKLINAWGIFHISCIVLVCSYSIYHKYCRFYKIKEDSLVKNINANLLFNVPMLYYGKFTGTESGYGFFAPNIKSGGIIAGDCDGKKIYARFNNFETAMRFSILSSRVTDYLITSIDSADSLNTKLKERYYNLVFKNIAVKIYNQNHCKQDTLYMSYNMITYPTLHQYRRGHQGYRLQKIKEIRIVRQ